ncbi:MAG: uroporphyrinogen decarboxylase family protein [Armatimonadota bacterium]|nr:uroporphyrinogen decarboxylase family protein [Armatimonadota bacterium]
MSAHTVSSMSPRERYRAIMDFRRPDRPFIWTFPTRKGTMDEWVKQGHPTGISTAKLLGYDWFDGIPLNTSHYPKFEQIIVEEKDGQVTYYDEEGALRIERRDAQGSGFVTRKWLKFPVEDRDDFLRMKERYVPEDLGRRGEGFDEAIRRSHYTDRPVMFTIQGFYWTLRQWMGFEGLSMAFYDMPNLVDEMLDFVLDFNVRLLRNHLGDARVDNLMINEDMAYKTACMVSPAILREKFLPRYRELVQEAKRICADKVFVDSDGHISELIPFWIEAGVDGTSPVEIAAEQDIVDYAEKYPDFLFIGGLDKRCLIGEKADVEAEVIPKARKLYARLGWIPAVDHAVPPNAKFENFKYMIELLKELW